MKNLSMIVAIAKNNAIGKNNDLLWHLPSDLKRFKEITTGKNVLMGKNTFESLPIRPLPNRKSFVITDVDVDYPDSVLIYNDLKEMIYSALTTNVESIIMGGGMVYSESLNLVDKLYLTVVDKEYPDADVYFPQINFDEWEIINEIEVTDDKIPYTYYEMIRK